VNTEPVLELIAATVEKDGRRVLDGVTLTIDAGEHTAIVGPNGAGKSILVRLLTHEDRAIAPDDGSPPVRVFGNGNWHVFELRQQLGIVSADLHQRFVAGNSEGRISAEAAVLSGCLASDGILRYGSGSTGRCGSSWAAPKPRAMAISPPETNTNTRPGICLRAISVGKNSSANAATAEESMRLISTRDGPPSTPRRPRDR